MTIKSPNPNPSSRWSKEEEELDSIIIEFRFGYGLTHRPAELVEASRRKLVSEKENFVVGILGRIGEDDLPKGVLEDAGVVNYIYNGMRHLPKDAYYVVVKFYYDTDGQRFGVRCGWWRASVEKHLDENDADILSSSCAVCLEDMMVGDQVCYLFCKHFFHLKCITSWTTANNFSCSCPLCRFPHSISSDSLEMDIEEIHDHDHGHNMYSEDDYNLH